MIGAARAIHGVYSNAARQAVGEHVTVVAAFDKLTGDDQEGNREQADDLARQLQAVLLRTTPLADWDAAAVIDPADVEVMAELEHLRWAAGRVAHGWRYAPARDRKARGHPHLVPWALLTEQARDINRAFVRARPSLEGRVGRGITPDPAREAFAAAVHRADRERVATIDGDVPSWQALSERQRAASRVLVAALPAMLLRSDGVSPPRPGRRTRHSSGRISSGSRSTRTTPGRRTARRHRRLATAAPPTPTWCRGTSFATSAARSTASSWQACRRCSPRTASCSQRSIPASGSGPAPHTTVAGTGRLTGVDPHHALPAR
jgi:hypothetical protein